MNKLLNNRSVALDLFLKELPRDFTKEYVLMSHYDEISNKKMSHLFDMLSSAVASAQLNFLNLEEMQLEVNQLFKFFFLKRRYDKLLLESQNGLHFNYNGWHLHDARFETLDEVERALAQKAFL
jgi:hypothetical protein